MDGFDEFGVPPDLPPVDTDVMVPEMVEALASIHEAAMLTAAGVAFFSGMYLYRLTLFFRRWL